MASPTSYPDEKHHDPALQPDEKRVANAGYADGLESDGEIASFTALIAEGEIHSIQSTLLTPSRRS
jgi:hypothetical protein